MDNSKLEQLIDYEFCDKSLLLQALTHSSYANEKTGDASNGNERLEFLGDAVLETVISYYLFEKYTEKSEGELTKMRASLVCERSLGAAAKRIGLGNYMLLGRGEESGGGRKHVPILADCVEAVIGASYIDGSFAAASRVVYAFLRESIEDAANGIYFKDSKTQLQEVLQKSGSCNISYRISGEEGPDHAKSFTAEVYADGKLLGEGRGKSKKEAESAAAEDALSK